jgi:2-polyprenyl-3-methyl-5-hydroxy-6-metoxy-1,4-benzoquinol methylase
LSAGNLLEPAAWINESRIPAAMVERPSCRKFLAHLQLAEGSNHWARTCSHYLPFENKAIGKDYYFGDDYADYPRETDVPSALDLVQRHVARGRLLDVGCALGIYTKAFLDAGFDAYGIDISEFAVTEAINRVGAGRIARCNLDESAVPFEHPFEVFWLWDVLEHSANPQKMLETITASAAPGSWLFLHTSNAESLTHALFQEDWEGFCDYSHYGVRRITATNLPLWLKNLGWNIVEWNCGEIWVPAGDPVALRLFEAFHVIPELAVLLSERNLGDFIRAVACKGPSPE